MSNVKDWLKRIVGSEGGYTVDNGGETKWGISKKSYPNLDIKNLTVEQAEAIYQKDFLSKLRTDMLEDGTAFQLLDFAVNSGVYGAIKCIQKEFGCHPDGIIGPDTLLAFHEYKEAPMMMKIIACRLEFMASLSVFDTYGRGWVNRMAHNLRFGVEDL